MNCREVTDLLAGGGALPAGARAHAASCPSCGPLLALIEAGPGAPSPPAAAIAERLASGLAPVKPLAARTILAILLAVFVLATALGAAHWHVFAPQAMTPLQAIVVYLALGLGAVLLAVSLMRQMFPGSRHNVAPSILPAAVLGALAVVVAALFRVRPEAHYLANGLWCLKAGSLGAILPALVFGFVLRRGAILEPRAMGAAAGALAGLAGTAILEIHCPNMNMLHILVWHLGPAVGGALAGWIVGGGLRFWFRFR